MKVLHGAHRHTFARSKPIPFFVAYDNRTQGYVKTSTETVHRPQDGKVYKSLKGCKGPSQVSNVSRNIPPNHDGASKYYRDLPQVEVREFDNNWNLVATHEAPPK